jgi:hypothetical protein
MLEVSPHFLRIASSVDDHLIRRKAEGKAVYETSLIAKSGGRFVELAPPLLWEMWDTLGHGAKAKPGTNETQSNWRRAS